MTNPFLFNSYGGAPPQQQNYPSGQQNQGWNQNNAQSTQSNFQSPQMDFFDMTSPQFNQAPTNSKPLGANDFRSLMNSPSNDSTSQFTQQIQPPRDLNQLRSIFTREDEPIIAPITPQTNQPPPSYSTSTYSPSFTFIPETAKQNQSISPQGQIAQTPKQPQNMQSAVDFSKYDPLAGEIINSNIAKQKESNENSQSVGKLPDGEAVPMVFYGADSTIPVNGTPNQIQFSGNFPPIQANQNNANVTNVNQNQVQNQSNLFNAQQSNQTANPFISQPQQQQNANFFNIPATQQSQSPNVFNIPNMQQQPQPAVGVFNNQVMQQPSQPAQPVQQQQQNTDFFNIQSTQQQPVSTPTQGISGEQNQQHENSNVFVIPNAHQTNSNPFLPPQKAQPNSTDITIPMQIDANTPSNVTSINEGQAKSNPSLSMFDMFRTNDNQPAQPQQQNSNPVTNLSTSANQQNSALDDIFGNVIQQKPAQEQQQPQPQPQQQQQQADDFDPFGRKKNASQQQESKLTVSSDNPFAIDNTFKIEVTAPKSEPTFAAIDDGYNPFGESTNDKENPFNVVNPIEKVQPNPPPPPTATNSTSPPKPDNAFDTLQKPPVASQTDPTDNPFVGIHSTDTNPFISEPTGAPPSSSSSNQEKQINSPVPPPPSPFSPPPPPPPPPAAASNVQEPFDPFGRNTKSGTSANSATPASPSSATNNTQEPFHPFAKPGGQNSSTETKKDSNMSSIDYMRSLFASSSNDLFTKPAEQSQTTTAVDADSPKSPQDQNQQPESQPVSQTATPNQAENAASDNSQQNAAPVFDPFGVGSTLPVMEGASFTFSIDDHEEKAKSEESQNQKEEESPQKVGTEKEAESPTASPSPSSTTTAANNNDSPFFSMFDISQPPPKNQNQTQQPQIVDDLFFDFSSIPPPKSDSNNDKKAADDFTSSQQQPATANPSAAAEASVVDENIRPGTDESSMSLSGDDEDENVAPTESQSQPPSSSSKDSNAQISLSDAKTGSVGFYSDGVNTFTFDADKERLSGPNPFEISKTQNQDAKVNPFVTNAAPASSAADASKFNPFTIPPPKNGAATDVFKVAEPEKKESTTTTTTATITSTSDASFNPFGPPPPKPKPQEQPDPFAPPPASSASKNEPSTDVFKVAEPEKKESTAAAATTITNTSDASFNPFGKPPPKPKPQEQPDPFAPPPAASSSEKPKEDPQAGTAFSPFGPPPPKPKAQEQPDPFAKPSSSPPETQASEQPNDDTFNPFGQVFPPKGSDANTSSESSFTFKLRSNQTPDIDENDFLPVGQQQQAPITESQQQQQSFSPFGSTNQPQQQQQQTFSPFGFGAFGTANQQQQPEAASQNQQQNGDDIKSDAASNVPPSSMRSENSSSSQNLSFVKRPGTYSPSDPFSLLIASLNPFTESPAENAEDEEEGETNGQNQQGHHHNHHNHNEEGADENEDENPFASWNPTELDASLGKCEEPDELSNETLNKFRGKVPPPPTFVAFEQSNAAKILKEYCNQLSSTGTSLEHINELLGIQDMARISIEEFSA